VESEFDGGAGMSKQVKVKLWSMNETRRFAAWLRNLKGKSIRVIEVSMNEYERVVTVLYEVIG